MKHKHLIVRAELHNIPKYEQTIIDWTNNLIRDIGMKVMLGRTQHIVICLVIKEQPVLQ